MSTIAQRHTREKMEFGSVNQEDIPIVTQIRKAGS